VPATQTTFTVYSLQHGTNYIFTVKAKDLAGNSSIASNSIYSIYRDSRDNIWIGTFNAGVNLVSRDINRFIHYKHLALKNSLSHNKVLCIYEDAEKNVWIGTDGGGANLFDPKTGRFITYRYNAKNKNSICGDYVLSICEDSKGNLWFGTWADGITVYNKAKNTYRHFKNNPDDLSSVEQGKGPQTPAPRPAPPPRFKSVRQRETARKPLPDKSTSDVDQLGSSGNSGSSPRLRPALEPDDATCAKVQCTRGILRARP